MGLNGGLGMNRAQLATLAFTIAFAAVPASAANQGESRTAPDQPLPAQVQRLMECRAIADSAQRLSCFDREAGTVAEAVAKRDLVVVDREGVRRTKRTLFGLSLPKLGIFDSDGEEISQIESMIDGVGHNSDGGYVFILNDGSRWTQIDDRPIALEPERGDKVVVKRAALGSFMLSVARQPGVRVRRVN